MGNKKEMLLEPGSKGFSTNLIGPIELVRKGWLPDIWEVLTECGDVKFVSEHTFYGFPEKEKNPWKTFATNGDEPPGDLIFGFSRFVVGKDKDGVKYPVVFDNYKWTWHTPAGSVESVFVNQGSWEEVKIVAWREL